MENLSNLPNKDELKASGFLDKRAAIATISDLANKVTEDAEILEEDNNEEYTFTENLHEEMTEVTEVAAHALFEEPV